MLQFKLSSADHRQLDKALTLVLGALRPEDRASASVSVLPREGGRQLRQLSFEQTSDKLVQTIRLLPLPGDVSIEARFTDEPKG